MAYRLLWVVQCLSHPGKIFLSIKKKMKVLIGLVRFFNLFDGISTFVSYLVPTLFL